jgi:hypothetical protein
MTAPVEFSLSANVPVRIVLAKPGQTHADAMAEAGPDERPTIVVRFDGDTSDA